jgi:hypothetical protein
MHRAPKTPPECPGEEPAGSTEDSLAPTDLLPGDVLLFRPHKPNIIQRKIAKATNSPYSHAAIYLGNGCVADSDWPSGVAKRSLESRMQAAQCVAVMRSQYGFSENRPADLNKFVDATIESGKFYDLLNVVNFEKNRDEYFDNQLKFIEENYEKATLTEEFSRQSFFCSAFVVACYSVVGIIGETAQAAYHPQSFSPGCLGEDPTFGWLLGHLLPKNGSVPGDDPLLTKATRWRDMQGCQWW